MSYIQEYINALESVKQAIEKAYLSGYEAGKNPRTWVGLTDKETMQICVDCGCLSEDWLVLLDAIEAKLKEKNT
jgi:hypothetical protein